MDKVISRTISEIDKVKNENLELNDKLNRAREENERLKEEITKLSDPRYQISKVNEGYYNRMNTYKQALQEIRDIAKEHIVCDDCNFEGTDKCDARMCTHFYLNDFSEEICDKINEVIGAE